MKSHNIEFNVHRYWPWSRLAYQRPLFTIHQDACDDENADDRLSKKKSQLVLFAGEKTVSTINVIMFA